MQFDHFCKTVLKNESKNINNQNYYILKNEKTFSDLTHDEYNMLSVSDKYSCLSNVIISADFHIEVEDEMLFNAIKALPEQKRNIIILSYWLGMKDEDISKKLNIVRRTEVDIPNGTTTIGSLAFEGCEQLEDVSLPNSLNSIGNLAFVNCIKLEEIVIPSGVTNLGSAAFAGCTSLTSAVIPGSISEISYSAFAGCTSLSNVTLGNGIESIMQYAFAGCEALTQITIPSSVTYIDELAFVGSGIEL